MPRPSNPFTSMNENDILGFLQLEEESILIPERSINSQLKWGNIPKYFHIETFGFLWTNFADISAVNF